MGFLDDSLDHLAGEGFLFLEAGWRQREDGLKASGIDEASASNLDILLLRASSSKCRYLLSFLCFALSKLASQHTVSSNRWMCLEECTTMLGLRSVGRAVGRTYNSPADTHAAQHTVAQWFAAHYPVHLCELGLLSSLFYIWLATVPFMAIGHSCFSGNC